MSTLGHHNRLIDSVCNELNGMASDLRCSHTINGEWPANEQSTLERHDHLVRMARELRQLKLNQDQPPAELPKGDVKSGGKLFANGEEHERALVVVFEDDESIRQALKSGRCQFTVFGGEV